MPACHAVVGLRHRPSSVGPAWVLAGPALRDYGRVAVVAMMVLLSGMPTGTAATLIGLYQFNNPVNLGQDESGLGNEATNFNATYTTLGYQDGAASFDGSAYLRSPIDVNPTARPKMTWGAWARPTVTNPIRTVLSGDNSGFDRTITIDSRGGTISWSSFTGLGVLGSGVTPSTTAWTFLAAVYDQPASSLTFYVDGQSFTTTSSFGASHTYFDIGRNPDFGELFSGSIDNVFVYDDALSPSEVAEIRTNGFPAVPEPSTSGMSLAGLAWGGWSMWRRRKQA